MSARPRPADRARRPRCRSTTPTAAHAASSSASPSSTRALNQAARAPTSSAARRSARPKRSRSSARSSSCSARRRQRARPGDTPRLRRAARAADGAARGAGGPLRRVRRVPRRHPGQARGGLRGLRSAQADAARRAPAPGAVGCWTRPTRILEGVAPAHRTLRRRPTSSTRTSPPTRWSLKLRDLAAAPARARRQRARPTSVEARLKGARARRVRALRDRSELFEDGGNVIKLGPRTASASTPSRSS